MFNTANNNLNLSKLSKLIPILNIRNFDQLLSPKAFFKESSR